MGKAFIIDSWSKSLGRTKSSYNNLIPKKALSSISRGQIDKLLDSSSVKVIYIDENQEVKELQDFNRNIIMLGYIVFKKEVLMHAYTKLAFRKRGHCMKLLRNANLINNKKLKVSKVTNDIFFFAKKNGISLEYLPLCPI